MPLTDFSSRVTSIFEVRDLHFPHSNLKPLTWLSPIWVFLLRQILVGHTNIFFCEQLKFNFLFIPWCSNKFSTNRWAIFGLQISNATSVRCISVEATMVSYISTILQFWNIISRPVRLSQRCHLNVILFSFPKQTNVPLDASQSYK